MLAVVAAFRQEIGEFLKAGRFRESERPDGDWGRLRFYTSRAIPGVAVVEGGFGRDGATESVRGAIARCPSGAPDAIICAGFSAGATEGLTTGDVVVGSRTVAPFGDWEGPPRARLEGGALAIETERGALLRVRNALAGSDAGYAVASCLTAPAFVSSPATKRRLGAEYGVSAIDMESYWAVVEASRYGTPCVPIRVILDPVEQSVSRLVENTLEDTRMRRVFRSAGYLATHPKETRELLRLSGQVKLAGKSLSDLLTRLAREEGGMGGFLGGGS